MGDGDKLMAEFAARIKRQEKAEANLLARLIDDAKAHGDSLYDAAKRIVATLPRWKRHEGHDAAREVIDNYREKVADDAVWPAGRPLGERTEG